MSSGNDANVVTSAIVKEFQTAESPVSSLDTGTISSLHPESDVSPGYTNESLVAKPDVDTPLFCILMSLSRI